ncbi:FadR/GntR family transcriptional regulator [Alkalihalobacillus pseudalcaliphilus]|uniref:FadR/GntR family transcriptional regulator n=1 Tax=Alkalihalobacillus pseudalcaliphilus TaxID=79884 RepID=UPI00064E043F|nr:FCD domain-containing protein [Alkalihalobacillus pseudalcaliphilus]KMK74806.1 hypothetical protein AB990_18780 [Alkalihalobacillus pseudalcaliphilus]
MTNQPSKRFIDVIEQLHQFILDEGISSGDKLPSERVLSERLGVGRSSVREALRALELLDLIETKRGEGTFLSASGSHRLVDIILLYMLKDDQARQDLGETRLLIELDAVRLAVDRISEADFFKLEDIYQQQFKNPHETDLDHHFHKILVTASNNKLLINIWNSLVDFHQASFFTGNLVADPKKKLEDHRMILTLLREKNKSNLLSLLEEHLKKDHF